MIHVMVGDTRSAKNLERLKQLGWGRMFVEAPPTPWVGEKWGFDNAAFTAWRNRLPWDGDAYMRRLDRAIRVSGSDPYLAVVPDKPAECGSLEFSLSWINKLPSGWSWYLAVQDGMQMDDVRDVIHMFSGLFLGGSDRFKATAWGWCKLAHSSGKKFHYGRAGTPRKLIAAIRCGADSCDSAFPLWSAERFKTFHRVAANAHLQREIQECR